ncbi:MAG: hypothetical protein AAF725_23485, partial [Acidobacteriota bacterium]
MTEKEKRKKIRNFFRIAEFKPHPPTLRITGGILLFGLLLMYLSGGETGSTLSVGAAISALLFPLNTKVWEP